jgi:hypothetical protein
MNVRGEDLLDAIIVLECTMFIQRVKSLKEDPENDWDFPLDYPNIFFKRLLPKPTPKWMVEQAKGTVDPWMEEIVLDSLRYRQKIMYVPVLDRYGGTGAESYSALGNTALLENFPWAAKDSNSDGKLDQAEAEKIINQHAFSDAAKIPIISETYDVSNPTDKYNGGALFFRKDWELDDDTEVSSGTAGRWMLQYFCKIDSELWEQINDEDVSPPLVPEASIETPGLRNLLYLFEHRGPNLKGHMNPNYWNDAMQAFFNELDDKIAQKSSPLEFTEADLKKFRQRHGAHYAQIHMGLRLCWWVPSGMPHSHDEMKKYVRAVVPEGWTNEMGPLPPEVYRWYTEDEYGDVMLIKAYKAISSNSTSQEKMRQKFTLDKAHAYVHPHVQKPVIKTWEDPLKPDEDLTDQNFQEKIIPEYSFCFPICEVLTDDPITLLAPGLDPEKPNTGDWQIMESDLTMSEPWNPDTALNKLIRKMSTDPEFKILFEYIFPISSIIPEIATIYGMEFFKPVADYMNVRKRYFSGVRAASDAIMHSIEQQGNYNFDGSDEPDISPTSNR